MNLCCLGSLCDFGRFLGAAGEWNKAITLIFLCFELTEYLLTWEPYAWFSYWDTKQNTRASPQFERVHSLSSNEQRGWISLDWRHLCNERNNSQRPVSPRSHRKASQAFQGRLLFTVYCLWISWLRFWSDPTWCKRLNAACDLFLLVFSQTSKWPLWGDSGMHVI